MMRVLVFTNMYPFEGMPFYGSFVEREAASLRALGIDLDVYFVNGIANKLSYLASPFGLSRRLSAKQYDLVHVHHSFCGYVATHPKRIPVVWTFHEGEILSEDATRDSDKSVKRLAYSKGFKRSVAQSVDALIVVAEHLKVPLDRPDATTLPSGIDTDRFRPMDRAGAKRGLGLVQQTRYVLFPSTPTRVEKRFELAKAGIDLYNSQNPSDAVELICLDNVPHEQVPLFMNACEVMLMTSAFEASPVTVREILACNVPVISTDVGDVRGVIAGINGCAVAHATAESIAQALVPALAQGGYTDSRERMMEYSLETTAKKIVDVYNSVTAGVPR